MLLVKTEDSETKDANTMNTETECTDTMNTKPEDTDTLKTETEPGMDYKVTNFMSNTTLSYLYHFRVLRLRQLIFIE